jgi:hypothetical protein
MDAMDVHAADIERPTTLTVLLRCDAEATTPVLKQATLKDGCDLQLEFVSTQGCPSVEPPDDNEGEWALGIGDMGGKYGPGADEGEDEGEPRWSACIGGATGCSLGLLLDPTCNAECATDECFWDNGACHQETMGCLGCDPSWLNDVCSTLDPDPSWLDAGRSTPDPDPSWLDNVCECMPPLACTAAAACTAARTIAPRAHDMLMPHRVHAMRSDGACCALLCTLTGRATRASVTPPSDPPLWM